MDTERTKNLILQVIKSIFVSYVISSIQYFIMTKQMKYLFLVTTTCILASCSSTINMNDYIDKNSSFTLTLKSRDKMTALTKSTQTDIAVNSKKYLNLIKWINNNESGWQWTPASYITNVSLEQGSFRLLYMTGMDAVVISFIDKENKARQYSKPIKKGELNFLTTK